MKLTPKQLKKLTTIQTFGNSMYPVLFDKDIIHIQKAPFSKLHVDDIVTFYKGKKLITHRIIYKTPHYIITKGDTNPHHDGNIRSEHILGKVLTIERNGKLLHLDHIYLYQSTTYMQEITAMTSLLQKNNTDFVILKGLPLYLSEIQGIPKRLYADCDILVSHASIKECFALFTKQGYRLADIPDATVPKILRPHAPEFEMVKNVNGITISFDIHTQPCFLIKQFGDTSPLYAQQHLDDLSEELLKTKTLVKIANTAFPLLQQEYLVLYLALHLFSHTLQGYNRYDLLTRVIRNHHIHFEKLGKLIQTFQLETYVYPVFLIIQKKYAVSIPVSFMKMILPSAKTQRYIQKNLLSRDIFSSEQKTVRGEHKFRDLFFLSPRPFFIRLGIFLKPQILYAIGSVTLIKLDKQLRRFFY